MTKELLFSITEKDCEFIYTRGTGPGGQKKNKTSSACHCKHADSGASGYSETSRSQRENKELAFKRMVESAKFQAWLKLETSNRMGDDKKAQEYVEREMKNVLVEVKSEKGTWIKEDMASIA